MDFQRLLPNLEGVLAPVANEEILQIIYFLPKVIPAVPSHSSQVLVCFKVGGFGGSALLRCTVSPLSLPLQDQLPPASLSIHRRMC